jgi:hypothetical protein
MIRLQVECYSGYKADQRPSRFRIENRCFEVEAVEDQWYSPESKYFRVRAGDGNIYVLRHEEAQDRWTLEAYRKSETP